jgi:hypothetical protein
MAIFKEREHSHGRKAAAESEEPESKAPNFAVGNFAKHTLTTMPHRQETIVGRVEALDGPGGTIMLCFANAGPILESVWADPATCTLVKTT